MNFFNLNTHKVSPLWCPLAFHLSLDVPTDVDFLHNKAAILRNTIKVISCI